MDAACLYGALAFGSFLIAMASHHPAMIKYSLLMLASCAASNLCVAAMGYERAPILIAPIDGVLALILANVARKAVSLVGMAMFILFCEEMAVHCVGFVTYATGQWGYWAALNVIFLAQVVINGGAGVAHGLDYWSGRLARLSYPLVSGR